MPQISTPQQRRKFDLDRIDLSPSAKAELLRRGYEVKEYFQSLSNRTNGMNPSKYMFRSTTAYELNIPMDASIKTLSMERPNAIILEHMYHLMLRWKGTPSDEWYPGVPRNFDPPPLWTLL